MAGTRWIKIDLAYLRNPKTTAVSTQAVMLHLASMLWTADELKDGYLPAHALTNLAHAARIPRSSALKRVDELVKVGLWESNGTGWYVHDFDTMNPQALRSAVERQRAKWRAQKGYSPVDSTADSAGDSTVEGDVVPRGIPRHDNDNDYEW